MLAVGFDYPVPPQVGKLSIYVNEWDWTDMNNIKETKLLLQSHICTKEELGLT